MLYSILGEHYGLDIGFVTARTNTLLATMPPTVWPRSSCPFYVVVTI